MDFFSATNQRKRKHQNKYSCQVVQLILLLLAKLKSRKIVVKNAMRDILPDIIKVLMV